MAEEEVVVVFVAVAVGIGVAEGTDSSEGAGDRSSSDRYAAPCEPQPAEPQPGLLPQAVEGVVPVLPPLLVWLPLPNTSRFGHDGNAHQAALRLESARAAPCLRGDSAGESESEREDSRSRERAEAEEAVKGEDVKIEVEVELEEVRGAV